MAYESIGKKQTEHWIYLQYLHLYSIVFMSARKRLGFWRFSDYGVSDKGYPTCIIFRTVADYLPVNAT
jgi:hypothetical protein